MLSDRVCDSQQRLSGLANRVTRRPQRPFVDRVGADYGESESGTGITASQSDADETKTPFLPAGIRTARAHYPYIVFHTYHTPVGSVY